jgi:hypothetical protein
VGHARSLQTHTSEDIRRDEVEDRGPLPLDVSSAHYLIPSKDRHTEAERRARLAFMRSCSSAVSLLSIPEVFSEMGGATACDFPPRSA